MTHEAPITFQPASLRHLLSQQEGIKTAPNAEIDLRLICPCNERRSQLGAKDLAVKLTPDGKAVWNCFHCTTKGGMMIYPPSDGYTDWARHNSTACNAVKEYDLPDRIEPKGNDPRVWDYLDKRGFNRETLERFGIFYRDCGMVEHVKDDKGQKVMNFIPALIFPFYDITNPGKVIAYKKRSMAFYPDGMPKPKTFSQSKNSRPALFGAYQMTQSKMWNRSRTLVITEGEFDMLASIMAGVKSVVSMQSGANKADNRRAASIFDADEYKFIKETVQKVILAGDIDVGSNTGMKLMSAVGDVLGRDKCRIVRSWGNGCKDANDCLVKYGRERVRECLQEAITLMENDEEFPPDTLNPPLQEEAKLDKPAPIVVNTDADLEMALAMQGVK